jgi:hypothetical protein
MNTYTRRRFAVVSVRYLLTIIGYCTIEWAVTYHVGRQQSELERRIRDHVTFCRSVRRSGSISEPIHSDAEHSILTQRIDKQSAVLPLITLRRNKQSTLIFKGLKYNHQSQLFRTPYEANGPSPSDICPTRQRSRFESVSGVEYPPRSPAPSL